MSLRIKIIHIIIFSLILSLSLFVDQSAKAQSAKLNLISLPISVYILDDERGKYSSGSRNERMVVIFEKVNKIWSQAGINFQIKYIGRITLQSGIIRELVKGNHKPFLEGRNIDFKVPNPSLFNAYYASSIGFLNGLTFDDNLILVTDSRDVETYRVTAHELGHLLGLSHAHQDDKMLMYPGTKGTKLTTSEIKTARDAAIQKLNSNYGKDY